MCAQNFRILAPLKSVSRRGVRVVEGARLESVYTRKGIAGSNPALSAMFQHSDQLFC